MQDTEQFKIAILTKSSKRRNNNEYGCCIAGISESGEWIRLVADREGDSLPKDIGIDVKQVIIVNGKREPLAYQKENVVLSDFSITKENYIQYINKLEQEEEYGIFGNTLNSMNIAEMRNINTTLRFIYVQNLEIYWDGEITLKCKVRFIYNGNRYEGMPMTAYEYYTKKGSTPKYIGDAHIVVSLSNYSPFNKFVAAIYPDDFRNKGRHYNRTLLDETQAIYDAEQKAIAGRNTEIALNMIAGGEPIEKIMRYTGLTREVIKKLSTK
jgi:hypothetical protein